MLQKYDKIKSKSDVEDSSEESAEENDFFNSLPPSPMSVQDIAENKKEVIIKIFSIVICLKYLSVKDLNNCCIQLISVLIIYTCVFENNSKLCMYVNLLLIIIFQIVLNLNEKVNFDKKGKFIKYFFTLSIYFNDFMFFYVFNKYIELHFIY